MSRANGVYIVFTLIFAIGIWAILGFGSATLTAPEDLAGQWVIVPPAGLADVEQADRLTIDQSGRFFELAFKDGRRMHLTLSKQAMDVGSAAAPQVQLKLLGPDRQGWISGPSGGDEFDFRFNGAGIPADLTAFHAKRVERFYEPAEAKAKAATRPAQSPASVSSEPPHS
jgi:hypothetical protein